MKKAKIALAAIAVIAITGGVMAHKAQRGNQPLYVCSGTTCSFAGLVFPGIPQTTADLATITSADIQGAVCTDNGTADCTVQIVYSNE